MTQPAVSPDEAAGLARIAAEAATAVAGDLREAFRSTMSVDFKRDLHDPVTVHDRHAEQRIREILRDSCPDSTLIGEEAEPEGSGRVHWYIDPIDGTANFARGVAFFCTSIGVAVDGRMVAGAINDPMADMLFTATPDGAWCNGRRLTSQGAQEESAAVLVTGYPGPRELGSDQVRSLDHLSWMLRTFSSVRRLGSAALTLAHVAAGWIDGGLGLGIKPWDVSAGSLMVQAAGGRYVPIWSAAADPAPQGADAPLYAAPGYLATVGNLEIDVLAGIVDDLTYLPVR